MENKNNQCQSPTDTLTVEIPCRMLERLERYAQENDMDITGVMIEALDGFFHTQRHLTARIPIQTCLYC